MATRTHRPLAGNLPPPPKPKKPAQVPAAQPDPYAAAVYKAALAQQGQTAPPPGSYDPQLDAQGENQNLGYLWTTEDYDTANQRALDDYNQQVGQLGTTQGYTLSDLQKAQDRDTQQYGVNTQDLATQYQRLGTSQTQAANAAGVGGGGALVAAAGARAANQGAAQSKLDTSYNQSLQDIATSRERANAGYGTSLSGLQLGYQRGTEDRRSSQDRATASNALYNQQLATQKSFAAQQNPNLLPGTAPGETPAATTTTPAFQTKTINGIVYHVYPNGIKHAVRKATPTK